MDNYIPLSKIKSLALDIGFDDCGAVPAQEFDISFILEWLDKGYNAGMQYLEKNIDKRKNPFLLLENSKSIISFILSYNTQELDNLCNNRIKGIENKLKFASYSFFEDYHKSIKKKLYELIHCIQDLYPNFQAVAFVDSSPFSEKMIAQKAGLGVIGKNSCLINKKYGSKILFGEIIMNYFTDYSTGMEGDLCKSCDACIKACPNGAMNENKTINSWLCNSYQNMMNREEIPNEINLKGYLFGCDICLNACAWNFRPKKENSKILSLNPNMQNLIIAINEEKIDKTLFNKAKKNSAIEIIKYDKLLYNIEFAKKQNK